MPQSYTDLVRRFFEEIWNQRRIELIGEFITPQSILHTDEGDVHGAEEFRKLQYDPFTAAFPDLRVEVPNAIERGNEVVARWVGFATHTGDGLGFPATNKKVEFRGITWILGRDEKFGEGWQSSNIEDVIRTLMPRD
jgi:predicted ester cyclase